MTNLDIIRAWKDEEYRFNLRDEQRAMLPEHPAGTSELSAEQLAQFFFPDSSIRTTDCDPQGPDV